MIDLENQNCLYIEKKRAKDFFNLCGKKAHAETDIGRLQTNRRLLIILLQREEREMKKTKMPSSL